MNEVRAFVGHSFTEDDDKVVTAFLKYFDALKQLPINFSWVHAEPAEPTDLATKVMRLMADCNLFIAICTKKQGVILSSDLRTPVLRPQLRQAPVDKFVWKTSDWIIQEIGLALGKGLALILLLEKGVQRPGGLQGNIEHIEFDRDTPHACFEKILEMISTLVPRATPAAVVVADPRSSSETPATEPVPADSPADSEEWWRPEAGWNQIRYDIALGHILVGGEDEQQRTVIEAYLRSEYGQKDANKQRWNALIEATRLVHGKGGSLSMLKRLAQDHPDNAGVNEQLARALAFFGEHREAAKKYEEAASLLEKPAEKLRLLADAARSFAAAKLDTEVNNILKQLRAAVAINPSAELGVLRTLIAIREDEGQIPLLERIVELRPDDHDSRFSLAYRHAQASNDALALLHYTRIPEGLRTAAAWNNIGVSCAKLDLNGQAIDAYREAAESGETLAMSNLARTFLDAGFISEAKKECERAMQLPDPHRNVGSTWSDVLALPETERKKHDDVVSEVKPTSDFFRQIGAALTLPPFDGLSGEWEMPEGTLTATVSGNNFAATATYERKSFTGIFGEAFGLDPKQTAKEKHHIAYIGMIDGRTIKGIVSRGRVGEPQKPTTILGGEEKPEFLIVVTNDGRELNVMEGKTRNARFYSIFRKKV